MSVVQEARRVAAEFEFSDEQVQRGVVEFIRQMSKLLQAYGRMDDG